MSSGRLCLYTCGAARTSCARLRLGRPTHARRASRLVASHLSTRRDTGLAARTPQRLATAQNWPTRRQSRRIDDRPRPTRSDVCKAERSIPHIASMHTRGE
eukprot:3578262-Prymnesium_polylepis.1